MPILGGNNQSPIGSFIISDMDDTNGYYGYLNELGHWIIKKVTETDVRYCMGVEGYVAAWGDRIYGLDYDYIDEIF